MKRQEREQRLVDLHEQVERFAREAGETVPNVLAEMAAEYGYDLVEVTA